MDKSINSITLGGILSAIYAIITVLSIYVLPLLSVLSLVIMPIFAAYYASIYKAKDIIIFNISTLLICFIVGIGDPLYTLIYVLPTLVIGDMFGLFNKLNIKEYTTMFLQTIAYSITNILSLIISEKVLEVDIIRFIIADKWLYENMAFVILFILSGAEAILSSMFTIEKLNIMGITKSKENKMPSYGYITFFILFALSFIFINRINNLYFLFVFICLFIEILSFYEVFKNIKLKQIWIGLILFITLSLSIYVSSIDLTYYVGITLNIPGVILCLVKGIIFIYNKIRNRR